MVAAQDGNYPSQIECKAFVEGRIAANTGRYSIQAMIESGVTISTLDLLKMMNA